MEFISSKKASDNGGRIRNNRPGIYGPHPHGNLYLGPGVDSSRRFVAGNPGTPRVLSAVGKRISAIDSGDGKDVLSINRSRRASLKVSGNEYGPAQPEPGAGLAVDRARFRSGNGATSHRLKPPCNESPKPNPSLLLQRRLNALGAGQWYPSEFGNRAAAMT